MSGITAEVICDSVSPAGKRITTFLLKMPMFITPELLRHRAFSFSFSSNRAIPAAKQVEQVYNDPAIPNFWGSEQKGMSPGKESNAKERAYYWREAARHAASNAESLLANGAHKSIVNRVMMPFLDSHGLVTATEWDNFFALRCAPDADPVIHELAWRMWDAMKASKPSRCDVHLPFISSDEKGEEAELRIYMYASAMRCARLSYAKLDGSPSTLEEDAALAEERLAKPFHMSPFEHQAIETPHRPTGNFIGWQSARTTFFGQGLKTWNPEQAERDGWRTAFGRNYK